MGRKHNEHYLVRGGEVLAHLYPGGRQLFADYPAVEASYQTTDAFQTVRHLFEREAALLEVDSELENSEWLDIWEELKVPGLFVESVNGRESHSIQWIHFRDDRAWWFPFTNSPKTLLG